MATSQVAPLTWNVPIVDPATGNPTPYFQALIQQWLAEKGVTDATASAAVQPGEVDGLVEPIVGSAVAALPWKAAVRAKTAAALAANAYANGASGVGATLTATANGALAAVDGVALAANDRLLVDQEAAGANNGIYTVTQLGDATHPYILTRAVDADEAGELVNATVKVSEGTTFADQEWQCTTNAPVTVGTTALTWAAAAGGGGSAIEIEYEGSLLTSAPTSINFIGAGVTATTSGDDVTVDIPGLTGASAVKYTVATPGDAFIDVPLDSDNGYLYEVTVKGAPSVDATLGFRISNDNCATIKSGATDYKSEVSSSGVNLIALSSNPTGSGRPNLIRFTLAGMNVPSPGEDFVLTGTCWSFNSTSAVNPIVVGGQKNSLAADNWNGFRIFASAGNMNGYAVYVRKIY